jgi:hypothetical protein
MIKCSLSSVVIILSTVITAPLFAQTITRESGLHLANGHSGVGSSPSRRQDAPIISRLVIGRGTADAMASMPPVRRWSAGNETATMPWSAPVGHHQPTAADVPESASASRLILDQEDENVDRIVRGVCRSC